MDQFTYNPGVSSSANQSYAKGNSMLMNALMALMTSGNSGAGSAADAGAAAGSQVGGAMGAMGGSAGGLDASGVPLGAARGMNGY